MKMQANEGITSNQLEFLYNIFFTNNKDQNLKVEFSINGSFFIDPSPPPPSPSDFLVHSGLFFSSFFFFFFFFILNYY